MDSLDCGIRVLHEDLYSKSIHLIPPRLRQSHAKRAMARYVFALSPCSHPLNIFKSPPTLYRAPEGRQPPSTVYLYTPLPPL